MTTDTPQTDAERIWELERELNASKDELAEIKETYASIVQQPHFDEREVHCSCVPALRKEVERLRTDLCREREAHNKTREDLEQLNIAGATAVQAAKLFKLRAEKAEAKNVCLQELIQEFYEWSRRDYPTEAEVRDIMNRYYNLLNK